MKKIYFIVALFILILPSFAFAIPVVPGAPNGPGMDTRAAYACAPKIPIVIRVNTLADSVTNTSISGPASDGTYTGSFRAALRYSEPRIVVFEKSGYIQLQNWISVDSPCLTIAGQTAPSPGITIKGGGEDASMEIHTHDVLVQHIKFRGGDDYCSQGPTTWFTGTPTTGIVFDHITETWNFDEGFGIGGGSSPNAMAGVTIWRSIAAEGLNTSGDICNQGAGYYSHGFLIYHHINALIAQSITAENHMRNPAIMGGGSNLAFLNNIVSSVQSPVFMGTNQVGGGSGDEPWHVTHAGNVVIAGPESCCDFYNPTLNLYNYDINQGYAPDNAIYRNDNILINPTGFGVTEEINEMDPYYDPNVGAPPSQAPIPSNYTLLPASTTEAVVLANAGARPVERDAVDNQIISRVQQRKGDIGRSTIAEYGGWPTLAQNTRAFTLPANPHTYTSSGYTNLELALHAASAVVEGTGTNPTPQPPTPPTPPSPSGTRVPPSSSITDNSGNIWTISGTALLKNGVQAGAGVGSILLWYQNNIYALSTDNNWWKWVGAPTDWTNTGPNDPSVLPVSPDGTEIPTVSQIIDNNNDTWTLSGSIVLRNGVQAGGGVGTKLLWSNTNKIYTLSSDNAWWVWGGSSWTRLGPVKPSLGDLDKNHLINSLDWSAMNAKWFTSDANADLNKDGVVNAIDFSLMNANWLKTW